MGEPAPCPAAPKPLRVLVFASPVFFEQKWDEKFAALFAAPGDVCFYFKDNPAFGGAAAALAQRHSSSVRVIDSWKHEFHVAICIGGDGSLLWLNQFLKRHPVLPVIAVKAGTLGFLSHFTTDDLPRIAEALAQCTRSGFCTEKLQLVAVPRVHCDLTRADGAQVHNVAVNEVTVKSTDAYYRRFDIYVDEVAVMSVKCDALILSSQTGSTAYNAAVRGPLVAFGAEALIISAVAPFACNFRPVVVSRGQTVRVEIAKETRTDAFVYCDSLQQEPMRLGDSVSVSVGETAFNLISPDYFDSWVEKVKSLFNF